MKLIMDIPEEEYKYCKRINWSHIKLEQVDVWDYVISHGKPLNDELQEIRQEIENIQIYGEYDSSAYQRFVTGNQVKQMILEIIDTHISALNNDQ